MKKSVYYNLKKIVDPELIIYHHLGLGDHLICNGLVNYLSLNFNKVFLPVKKRNFNNVSYLYKENNKIHLFKVSNEEEDVLNYALKNNLKILKIGFEKRKKPFNSGFYKQLKLSYSISKDYFSFPRDKEKENALYQHLVEHFGIKDKFALIHSESSQGNADIKIGNALDKIFIRKDMDIFNNIFYYSKLIEHAEEIHCIDSSFLHLVDRSVTTNNLYFHNLKNNFTEGANLKLLKNWNVIEY